MAIIKRISKYGFKYQVKFQGSDYNWISGGTFNTKREAEEKEAELKKQVRSGAFISNETKQLTLDQYFKAWHEDTKGTSASNGWRNTQIQIYRDYVQPIIGKAKIQSITSAMILKVLQYTKQEKKRSSQTCLHVYNTLHKVFYDAVETHEVLERSPVKRKLKPTLQEKEADFLSVNEARILLDHVRGKPFEIAIWLGVYVGLRVGEVQALLWKNVDCEKGIIFVRRAYVRKENIFNEYPKGKKWHEVAMPPELRDILRQSQPTRRSDFVATTPTGYFLNYNRYLNALKGYCKELGLKSLGTHNLRHSTSSVWMESGASGADMKMLFAHSSQKVTDRYIHNRESQSLGRVANVIRLFPKTQVAENNDSSHNLPKSDFEEVDVVQALC